MKNDPYDYAQYAVGSVSTAGRGYMDTYSGPFPTWIAAAEWRDANRPTAQIGTVIVQDVNAREIVYVNADSSEATNHFDGDFVLALASDIDALDDYGPVNPTRDHPAGPFSLHGYYQSWSKVAPETEAPKFDKPLAQRILDYFVSPERSINLRMAGHAIADLAERGLYPTSQDVEAARVFNEYLSDNPQNFCDGGIRRAREELGVEKPQIVKTFTVTIKAEEEVRGSQVLNLLTNTYTDVTVEGD